VSSILQHMKEGALGVEDMGNNTKSKGLDEIELVVLKVTVKEIYGDKKPSGAELNDLLDSRLFKAKVRCRRRPAGRGA